MSQTPLIILGGFTVLKTLKLFKTNKIKFVPLLQLYHVYNHKQIYSIWSFSGPSEPAPWGPQGLIFA